MSAYPACRHAVVAGELKSIVIQGPEDEREGWLPSSHVFRALGFEELIQLGHPADEAAAIHEREKRRVALIFAGHSVEEAAEMSAIDPETAAAQPSADALAEIELLKAALAAKQAEMDSMVAKFDENWRKLSEECERLKEAKESPKPKHHSKAHPE